MVLCEGPQMVLVILAFVFGAYPSVDGCLHYLTRNN